MKFIRDDWLLIKKRQAEGWSTKGIIESSPWSETTVRRALRTATWRQYRLLVYKDTAYIRQTRAADTWREMGKFIDDPNLTPYRPLPSFSRLYYAVVLLLLLTLIVFMLLHIR
jgi:hypothetical protein